MKVKYSDGPGNSEHLARLGDYRTRVQAIINAANFSKAESSLATWQDDLMRAGVNEVKSKLGPIDHVVLVGIGGSSLGTEAIHQALQKDDSKQLHVLDTVSDHKLSTVMDSLKDTKSEQIAVCLISKSGGTTETLSNASVLLEKLGELYGQIPYDRVICIGNEGNSLLTKGEELGMHTLPMHEHIGGRYSVFTTVGLVPLTLLGYNINELLDGLKDASCSDNEELAAAGAALLYESMLADTRLVNFFAFDERLASLGAWYRQLTAESLGKAEDREGNKVEIGFVPTISTPVELHSIGQLYFSGFSGVYTDFVSLADPEVINYVAEDSILAAKVAGKSLSEIAYAIEGGVVAAYEDRNLPFRHTALNKLSEYDLGLFMGVRMLETMYLAELMNVDAFNQPNVELYKEKTREILDQNAS